MQVAREKAIDRRQDRNLVPRRSSDRPEEQDHPAVGQARHPPERADAISEPPRPTSSARSARNRARAWALILPACNTEAMNLHLAEIAKAVAPGAHAVLLVDQAGWHLSQQDCSFPPTSPFIALPPKCPELNPGRKHLAVYARQLALKPHLQILRRYRRPLLRCLEQAHRPPLENHVHRTAPMGTSVLINEKWY